MITRQKGLTFALLAAFLLQGCAMTIIEHSRAFPSLQKVQMLKVGDQRETVIKQLGYPYRVKTVSGQREDVFLFRRWAEGPRTAVAFVYDILNIATAGFFQLLAEQPFQDFVKLDTVTVHYDTGEQIKEITYQKKGEEP